MSNSKDMKDASQNNQFEPHPDFEELLKAERSRMSSTKKEESSLKTDTNLNLDDDFDHLDDYEEALEPDDELSDFKGSQSNDLKGNVAKKSEDLLEFSEVTSGPETDDQELSQTLDDSQEFNFDDASTASEEVPSTQKSDKNIKKEPIKKSKGMFFYVLVLAVGIVGAGVLYTLVHGVSHKNPPSSAQSNTGFKPVLPEVQALRQTLPPAVPQAAAPVTSAITMNDSNDQILTGTISSSPGSGGITMLQVNRQQLLELLANFQKTVTENGKSIEDQVASLKKSLSTITASDSQMNQDIDMKFQQMTSQMNQMSEKLSSYNDSISGIQSALEKTQQQLKLILAERAEDIDRYSLRAIVPGRAWLVDGQGKTVTLTTGEDLKNYGTVQEINDKMGYVTMSSGYVFK